jgi:(4S)-4-hydroxy-5-phosphonooxypentane-2,3-dione isomerase
MSPFAIIVDFRLQPGVREQFRRLMDANARMSAGTESGCRRFDVLEPNDQPDRVLLYEIYTDEAAFAEHMKSAHFIQFDAESAPLVSGKSIIRCDLVCEGSASNTGQD